MLIQSKENAVFKQYRHLSVSKTSKKSDYFLIEGIREISLALESGVQIDSIAFKQGDSHENVFKSLPIDMIKTHIFSIDLFTRLAMRKSGDNALAIAKKPASNIEGINAPIILILENIEKPGNLGAIARSADALGVTEIIITGDSIDIYNPNVIRSSLGAIFAINMLYMTNDNCLKYLSTHQYNIITTDLNAKLDYRKADYSGKIAIIMGSEAYGISQFWQKVPGQKVIIPMIGKVNSLNLSVSSAIMMALALSINCNS